MEFVLRRSLQNDHAKLPGLHPENKTKMTDTPTAERILKVFADVSLTIIQNAAGEDILRRLTPLSEVNYSHLKWEFVWEPLEAVRVISYLSNRSSKRLSSFS